MVSGSSTFAHYLVDSSATACCFTLFGWIHCFWTSHRNAHGTEWRDSTENSCCHRSGFWHLDNYTKALFRPSIWMVHFDVERCFVYKTQLLRYSISVCNHFVTQACQSSIFSGLFRSTDWRWVRFRLILHFSVMKSCNALFLMSRSEACSIKPAMISSSTSEGFSSIKSIRNFRCSSTSFDDRPGGLHFINIHSMNQINRGNIISEKEMYFYRPTAC